VLPLWSINSNDRYTLVATYELQGALFWDRRRPRLPTSPMRNFKRNGGRRGRLRFQKSAPYWSMIVT